MCLRAVPTLTLIIVMCGNVEVNPGPTRGTSASAQRSQSRQSQLSFAQVGFSPIPQSTSKLSTRQQRQEQR